MISLLVILRLFSWPLNLGSCSVSQIRLGVDEGHCRRARQNPTMIDISRVSGTILPGPDTVLVQNQPGLSQEADGGQLHYLLVLVSSTLQRDTTTAEAPASGYDSSGYEPTALRYSVLTAEMVVRAEGCWSCVCLEDLNIHVSLACFKLAISIAQLGCMIYAWKGINMRWLD